MTLGELFREGKNALLAAEVAEWELDAWYLLEYAAGCTKSSYYMHFDEPVEEEQVRKYRELIRRRVIFRCSISPGARSSWDIPFWSRRMC